MHVAINIEKTSCNHIGNSQVIFPDKLRDPRTAPPLMITPLNLYHDFRNFSPVLQYLPEAVEKRGDHASMGWMR